MWLGLWLDPAGQTESKNRKGTGGLVGKWVWWTVAIMESFMPWRVQVLEERFRHNVLCKREMIQMPPGEYFMKNAGI